MFDRPKTGERAILVDMTFGRQKSEDFDRQEFIELARSAGAEVFAMIVGQRVRPDAKYFLSKGKVEELQAEILLHKATLVLCNHELSPSQERNLERSLSCRVLSRTGLILDIFAQRARTHEGMLQVELAQLDHIATRLVRGWTHLERQKGGIGLRGPGETQLETDRRLVAARIVLIKERLKRVKNQRFQSRQKRLKAQIPTIALLGYTNAGKSTLFNKLTKANVLVADQLFATLDPTLRLSYTQDQKKIILADTVGFISRLPHKLINAFRSTLEESNEADLLIKVVDIQDPHYAQRLDQVDLILHEIGAAELPHIIVFNKIDLLESAWASTGKVEYNEEGGPIKVWVSSTTGAGLDLLRSVFDLLVK